MTRSDITALDQNNSQLNYVLYARDREQGLKIDFGTCRQPSGQRNSGLSKDNSLLTFSTALTSLVQNPRALVFLYKTNQK